MNLLKLSFFLMTIISIVACNSDDESPTNTGNCTQSDWIGTYTGTVDCDNSSDSGTVTITASGAGMVDILYETIYNNDPFSIEADSIPINGCEINYELTTSSISIKMNGTLDGDNLYLTEPFDLLVGRENCAITAVRD